VSAALGFDSDKYMPRREVSTIGSTASTRDSPRKSLIRTKGTASRWHGRRVRPTESTSFVQKAIRFPRRTFICGWVRSMPIQFIVM
jgi:hypothetical protein